MGLKIRPLKWFMGLSRWKKAGLLLGGLVVVSGASIAVTEQTFFCRTCHNMHPYYESWQASAHAEVNCLECHLEPGLMGHVKGKINGMVQAMDFLAGRMGTKPSGTVLDISCLRSECHATEELVNDELEYNGFKFTHGDHLGKSPEELGGLVVGCGTCHSHFEGDEHFSVNKQACFTCHFLRDEKKGPEAVRLVETKCQSCHEAPREPVERGLILVDHDDFVAYEASCEQSCHKKQIDIVSRVEETVCLDCHNQRMGAGVDSAELHLAHTEGEKVECFACHGLVDHESKFDEHPSSMLECQSCHSGTHAVQQTVYQGQEDYHDREQERVLSPMFLAHVECTGCHVEQGGRREGEELGSFGVVAKATAEACDRCHEAGTGERYIPYWQAEVRGLYEEVSGRAERLRERAALASEGEAGAMLERYEEARVLLDAVVNDGSWGVHNLKYSEAMLLKAKEQLKTGNAVGRRVVGD